jgi:hypothetical protein
MGTGHINSYSGPNLRRALWIMYHHVILDSKRSAQVWCRIQGFARIFVTMGTPKQPYQINSYSGSNLCRALWIMYHHVIHDSKRSTQVWCRIQGFAKVFVTIRDAGSTIIDACSTAQKYVLVKNTFLSQKFENALSVLTLTDIWRSLLARQLIVGWWAMILYFGHDISWF